MITMKRISDTCFTAAAPLEHVEATASTPEDALAELHATIDMLAYAKMRMRIIKKSITCSYDPQLGCYVAECLPAGITAQGFTRQMAMDQMMTGLKQLDEQRRADEEAAAHELSQSQEDPNVGPST